MAAPPTANSSWTCAYPRRWAATAVPRIPSNCSRYAACFESALATVARRRHLDAGEVAIDSAVSLLPTGDRGFKLAVTLDVTLPAVSDRETAAQLIREAHQVCPYSNATRGNIDVTLQLQGESL